MSDNDQTILSGRGISEVPGAPDLEEKPKRNPLVIIGGIGCALLLCAALFIGGGIYMAGEQISGLTAELTQEERATATEESVVEDPTPESSPTLTATETADANGSSDSGSVDEEADSPTPTDSNTNQSEPDDEPGDETEDVPAEPVIGSITFALDATDTYEPIDPGTEFEGEITEIHAIFDYSGFSPDNTWERVWFLDETEMLRSAEPWSGVDEGVFDYFINAGGEPLSPGEWTLELYVDDELLASDSFIIVGDEDAVALAEDTEATATATPKSATATPTPEGTASPTPSPQPVVRTYPLAFTKWDGGQHLLFVGDTNGGREKYILSRAAGPSFTPDGAYIFVYGEEGIDRQKIDGVDYVLEGVANGIIRIDASPLPTNIGDVKLYQGPGWNEGTARWTNVSPNGQMVAFDARPGGNYRIYFLGTDENQQFRFEIIGEHGDWSPNSQKVAYRSGRDGKTGIWVSNRDDSGHTLLTSNGSDAFPAWSPDGNTIVFHREVEGNVDLYAMNTDGSNVRRLTTAAGPDTLPEFTPDGEIIFRSARSGSWGIWKMNADGSNQQQIYADAGVGPDWSFSRLGVLR